MGDIFIVGAARTGTTLLRKLVSSHSAVVGVNETEILKRISPKNQSMREMVHMIARTPEEEDIVKKYIGKADLENKKVTSIQFLDIYCTAIKEHFHKSTYAEKSPVHSFFIDKILREISDSKVVLIVRDPRAALTSRLHTPRISRGKHVGLPRSVQFFLNLSELLFTYRKFDKLYRKNIWEDRVLFVSYRELVQFPEHTLQKLFHFAGLPFESVHTNINPLDIREAARNNLDKMNSSFGTEQTHVVSKRSLKNWEGKMSEKEIGRIEDVFARERFSFMPDLMATYSRSARYFFYSVVVVTWSYIDYWLFYLKNIVLKYKIY